MATFNNLNDVVNILNKRLCENEFVVAIVPKSWYKDDHLNVLLSHYKSLGWTMIITHFTGEDWIIRIVR